MKVKLVLDVEDTGTIHYRKGEPIDIVDVPSAIQLFNYNFKVVKATVIPVE